MENQNTPLESLNIPRRHLSAEALSKRRKFRATFKITKEKLSKKDITSILKAMHSRNRKINLEATASKILHDLDKKNQGYVETDDLIEKLISTETQEDEDDFTDIYNKINEVLHTKSEDIIKKLKLLHTKKWISTSLKYKESIDFIIKTITEENLYEFDTTDFKKKVGNKSHNGIDYLVKYSQIEDSKRKEEDFNLLRIKSKMYSKDHSLSNSSNSLRRSESNNKRRRSTDLTTMISPSIIATIHNQMAIIDQCDFNIFELDDLLGKKASIYVATEILSRFDVVDSSYIDQNVFKNFINEITAHYDRINAIYHNDLHAADVMQTCFTVFIRGNIQNNYHISQTFKVISKDEFNIFKNFTPEEYRICRRRIIDGIIATDMANHQKVLTATKTKVELYGIVNGDNFEKIVTDEETAKNLAKLFDSQQCILNMILHTADISNPGKPSKVSEQWTKKVYGEFFMQGDLEKEKSLPISNFCDRNTTNVNKAMVGFITFVVAPTIEALVNIIPEVSAYSDYCRNNLRKHQIGAKNDDRKALEAKKKKKN